MHMDYQRLPLEEFLTIYHKVPRAGVDLIVKTEKGIVLTERSIPPFKGMWHIPGGTILFMEPVEHAIARVAGDELGVEVTIAKHLGIIEYFVAERQLHTVANAFLVTIKSGTLRGGDQGKEVKEFGTVPENVIPVQGEFLKKNQKVIF